MGGRIYPVFEHPVRGIGMDDAHGRALGWVIDFHPDLAPLIDFCVVEPRQIAWEIGMLHPDDDDAEADFAELYVGPQEWFEAASGLSAVDAALAVLRADPNSVASIIYEPSLRQDAVMADLSVIRASLASALESETRFHFIIEADRGSRPK